MIDWKKKLTSRKFRAAVVGVVSGLLYTFGMAESEVGQIAYIIAEGLVDASKAQ